MNSFRAKMRRENEIRCPFCNAPVPPPVRISAVFSGEGCLGGRCACGAAYAVDETGRLGGCALLDAQAVLCDGDLDRAMKLGSVEIEARAQRCRNYVFQFVAGPVVRTSASGCAWFVRSRGSAAETVRSEKSYATHALPEQEDA